MRAQTNHTPWVFQHTPSLILALVLALTVHTLLFVALGFGIRRQLQTQVPMVVEAELWSEIPQLSATKLAPQSTPESSVSPRLETHEIAAAAPSDSSQPSLPIEAVDIAVEKPHFEKKKSKEPTNLQDLKEERNAHNNGEKKRPVLVAQVEKKLQQKNAPHKQALRDAKQDTQVLRDARRENIERMRTLAQDGYATHGTAAQSAGTSANYAARIRTLLKDNTIYTGSTAGNPKVEIEIRTSPNGRILSRKVVRASGVQAWDDAVLQAIDRTQVLPIDSDGRTPPIILVVHSPIAF